MQYELIPAELRARRQWVVWRSIVSDGRITKPPFQPLHPQYMARVDDPTTWGSFEDAVKCWEANPSLVQGVGFVFTENDDYFGIDIDDEAKVRPENLAARREFVGQMLREVDTYTEISPSGQGLHMIARGKLPNAGRRSATMGVEIYGSERYFTITANVFNGRAQITDQQEFVNQVYAAFAPPQVGDDMLPDITAHRRTDLSDEEVIRLATNFHPTFAPRFNAQIECAPGEWSDTFMAIVGIVDRFTGVVEQIERIILNSPMVTQAPPSAAGESRLAKAQRNFRHVLYRVRQGNNGLMNFAAHGRQQFENIERAKQERAKEAAEAIRKAEEAIGRMSEGSVSLLQAFPQLDKTHTKLTRPPGVTGAMVEATELAMHHPFTKFAIPATLASLAGILARGYKLPSGGGLNVNFILAAPTGTGKTQTMNAWEGFISTAARSIENTLQGPSRLRLISASASSIQGIFEDFMDTPSAVWFIEECFAQLTAMSDPKSVVDSQLRDAYNGLYDASRHGKLFSPPRSVANRKANIEPIENLSISTYWSTTDSKFDVFGSDALDGFLSRVIVIRHKGAGGDIIPPWQVQPRMPDALNQVLIDRLVAAKRLDETYQMSSVEAGKLITHVSTGEVDGLAWEMQQVAEKIKSAALDGKLNPAYAAVSRLPVTAMRLAAVLAVMENPYTPSVTTEQYKWAFGYLLQNLASLMNDLDRGEIGEAGSDEMLAIVRAIKHLLTQPPHEGSAGVPKSAVRDYVKRRKPFGVGTPGVGKRVSETIDLMIKEHMLAVVTEAPQGRGRPAELLCPTDDVIWRN